jgi:acetolactate synthase I/II/III large subunit
VAKGSEESDDQAISRRSFLGGAAGTAAGVAALGSGAPAADAQPSPPAELAPPSEAQLQREAGNARPPAAVRAAAAPGSDLMVDVLRDLGIEYVASNPGSSFEGLQESIINHGDPPNRMPEFITALHEMSAVDMASGYARAEGKPMAALLHGTLGLQNAAMAIYQAFSGRIPVVLLVGRDDGHFQSHTADDIAAIVRSFTKWDAHPLTLEGSLSAIQRARNLAMTPPCGPTLVVLDTERQKEEAPGMRAPAPPPLEIEGVAVDQAREIAQGLVRASNPRIAVGRLRTSEGVRRAVELAELVGASTSTAAADGSMSFPQRHPLCGPGARTDYDYMLGLETEGANAAIVGPGLGAITGRDTANIGFGHLRERNRRTRLPSEITADAEASLPILLEECRRLLTNAGRRSVERRIAEHSAANRAARRRELHAALDEKRVGWNGSPISTARLYAELWPLIMSEDWCLASPTRFSGEHHRELWDLDRPYSYLGLQPAGGMGYGLGQSVGAALAAKSRERIVINIQCDGDLNYSPGALWTAAHHRLPLLTIMHNNRAWHQELMFVQYMTGVRGRGTDRGHIGTTLRDPDIDYAQMAAAYGMAGEGPISDPNQLAAAYRRGVESVRQGRPYLIDVLTQPR